MKSMAWYIIGVANMPGAVPRTSTFALNNQTAVYRYTWQMKALTLYVKIRRCNMASTPTMAR